MFLQLLLHLSFRSGLDAVFEGDFCVPRLLEIKFCLRSQLFLLAVVDVFVAKVTILS